MVSVGGDGSVSVEGVDKLLHRQTYCGFANA